MTDTKNAKKPFVQSHYQEQSVVSPQENQLGPGTPIGQKKPAFADFAADIMNNVEPNSPQNRS